jgi:hypothetical protein
MSDNKVDNKLDFRNVKTSQFGGSQIERMEFSELQSAKRTFTTTPILRDAYTHFFQQTNIDGYPTYVQYWQATDTAVDKLQVRADVAGDLAGKYITLQEYITQRTHVFYYVVGGSGTAPGIGDVETPININTNDPASVVALATKNALDSVDEFTVTKKDYLSSYIQLEYLQFGETSAIDVGSTGFMSIRQKEGASFEVGEVFLDYDANNNPIYNGNTLRGLLYNPYTASFDVERDEIVVSAVVSLDPIISKDPTVYNVAMATAGTEYSLALPLETKRFQLNIRDHRSKYTVSWTSGGAVLTKSPGTIYEESGLEIVTGKDTIYFTATKDDMVMEIITWK